MKQKNLYERLKPEYKASIDKEYGKYGKKTESFNTKL